MFNPINKGDVMGENGRAIYDLDDREIDFISGGGAAYDWGYEVGSSVRSFLGGWGGRLQGFGETSNFYPAYY